MATSLTLAPKYVVAEVTSTPLADSDTKLKNDAIGKGASLTVVVSDTKLKNDAIGKGASLTVVVSAVEELNVKRPLICSELTATPLNTLAPNK